MSSAPRPDVVVVVLSGARAFDVAAISGDAPATTPRLDALAAQSLVFLQASATSPWTVPSLASLLTGLTPSRHGATEHEPVLAGDVAPTLAELLAADGYRTVAVAGSDALRSETGLARGYATVLRSATPPPASAEPPRGLAARLGGFRRRAEPPAASPAGAGAAVEHALRDTPQHTPLHLLVEIRDAHLPVQPADAELLPHLDDPGSLSAARAVNQDPVAHLTGAAWLTEGDRRLLRALYRAGLGRADAELGRVLDALAAAGRLQGALLVVTADHGENLGDHGLLGHHHSLNDTVLRVPLVVRVPGTAPARRDDLAQPTDVLPTACEVAAVATPAAGNGTTLTRPLPRSHQVAEYVAPHPQLAELMRAHAHRDFTAYDRGLRSIRTATRKYVSASDGNNELYDLAADPWEQDNLYGRGHADELALARALRRWEQAENAAQLSGVSADAEVSERLRALGYIE